VAKQQEECKQRQHPKAKQGLAAEQQSKEKGSFSGQAR
jgi:hypothetical protein